MKILVPVKRVVDYNVKIRVKADGSGVELANVKMSMNPFDEIAVEEALRLKEAARRPRSSWSRSARRRRPRRSAPALAMGADRGILVKTDAAVEPLAVAKLLKGVVEQEKPGLVILGKQAIDDDSNQTGQMLAALLGWPQGTFASKVALGDGAVDVTREVDGGLQTVEPQAAGDRHHGPAPQRAALRLAAEHHEGEEEADRREDARRARRRRRAAPEGAEDRRAAGPQGRRQGRLGRRTRVQARRRSGSDLDGPTTTLLSPNTTTPASKDVTAKALTAAEGARRARARPGRRRGLPGRRRSRRQARGVEKVLVADAPAYAHALAEPLAALIVGARRALRRDRRGRDLDRQERLPRVAALLDVMQVSDIIKVVCARHLRAPDLCRQRHPDRAVDGRQEGHHRAHGRLPGGRRRRLGRRSRPSARRRIRRSRPSRARRSPSPTGRS